MNRLTVIQQIIDAIEAEYYLEIGVCTGEVLGNINAKHKFGVDPQFQIPNINVNVKQTYNDANDNAMRLYEVTSDIFFSYFIEKDMPHGIDVAFVDGLHNYEQSLKDVKNCLKYLNDGGFIIMHDCNPLNFATAYPVKESINEAIELASKGEIPGWNGAWNGDVWKTLVHLRVEYDDLEIFTLDLDWGLGIIRKGQSNKLTDITIKDIEKADYYFLEKNREKLLNLQPPKYLKKFLAQSV